MQVFSCAWKINFPEIIFSWLGVLKALTRKWFEVKIFTSNHFRTHAQRERERERAFDFDFADLRTHHAFDFADLQTHKPIFDPQTFDFAGDLEPSRHKPIFDPEPWTHELISLSLCDFDFLCDFDRPTSLWSLIFLLLLWWCGWWWFGGFPVVWWWVLCE